MLSVAPERVCIDAAISVPHSGNANPEVLFRDVYCVLGLAIDAIEMPAVVHRIEAVIANPTTFLISTVNVNFLVASQFDPSFRESLLLSDLCIADGMPVVWIARTLGDPDQTPYCWLRCV